MTTNPLIYLASPYSDPDPAVCERRYQDALQAVSALHARGRLAFSPIVYGHILATSCGGPTDWEAWAALNLEMLARCDLLWVLMIPDWERSKGVQAEIREAERLGIPVRYLSGSGCPWWPERREEG